MVRSFLSNASSSSPSATIPASPAFLSQTEKRLLKFCKNNTQCKPETAKWNKKAVQCLLKTLKDDKPAIEELEKAVVHQSSATKCIRMPKTYENRLLVSHRRGVPHVIFSRIWRWPDLKSHHQLNAISNCECTKAAKKKEDNDPQIVCVNPYHYERRKPDPVPPVLVPILKIPPDLSTSFEDSNSTGQRTISDRPQLPPPLTGAQVRQLLDEHDHIVAGLLPPTQARESSRTSSIVAPSIPSSSDIASGSMYTHQATSIERASISSSSSELGQPTRKHKQLGEPLRPSSRVSSQQNPVQTSQRQASLQPPLPPRTKPDNHNSSSSPLTQEDIIMWTPRLERASLTHPAAEDDEYDALFNRSDASSASGPSGKKGPLPQWAPGEVKLKGKFKLGEPQPAPSPQPLSFRPRPGQDSSAYRRSLFVGAQEVPYIEVLKWCTITYLEHGSSFAEEFTPKSFVVTVDGSSNMPLGSHWSLGNIEGFEHNYLCAFIRRRIGKGLKLTYVDGDVYVENLNNSEALFVSSPVMSFVPGEPTVKEKVIRVPTKSSVKVFSTALFASILNEGLPRGYEYMCYLQSFCTFRISFVKGWGAGYKRFDFSETPCGLMVELNGHLEWVRQLTDLVKHTRKCKSGEGSDSD